MKTVFDMYNGSLFLEPSLLESSFAEGQRLVVSIRSGDKSPEESRQAVRAYLEQHAQVIGSSAIATARLDLYQQAEGLTDSELADKLERLITVSVQAGRRLAELEGQATATFGGSFR